jgi:hypothetical protein
MWVGPSRRSLRQSGAGAPWRSRPYWPGSRSEPQSGTGGHHRRSARAHGDDLLGVDPLQVDRRGAEVGVAELALDDVERNALTGELERMRVAQRVRRKAAPDPGMGGEPAEPGANGSA